MIDGIRTVDILVWEAIAQPTWPPLVFFQGILAIIKCIGFNTMMRKGDSGDSSVIAKYLVPGKSIAWESNP